MELRVMGKDISQLTFTQNDFNTFQNKLYQQLDQLKEIITYPEFGQGDLKIGAELEMYLVDDEGNVSLSNRQLLTDLQDEQFQPELNQYNIELNLSAFSQHRSPFTQLRNEILTKTELLEKAAAKRNINIIPIGILPTLK